MRAYIRVTSRRFLIHAVGETGDVNITATFIKFVDYTQLNDLINHSDTIHSGLRTVSLLISSDAPAGGWIS